MYRFSDDDEENELEINLALQRYQQLLPLCQLAFDFDAQGDPEQQAFKLAMIFKNVESAKKYRIVSANLRNCIQSSAL